MSYVKDFVCHYFVVNGLQAERKATLSFSCDNFDVLNIFNLGKHEAFYKAKLTHNVRNPLGKEDFTFVEGEHVKIEHSLKVRLRHYDVCRTIMIDFFLLYQFSETDTYRLFADSQLRPIQRWTDSTQRYSLWLLERPPFSFPLLKAPTPFGVPTVQDWSDLWSTWDCITRRMIPPSMLYQKPIDLRHICLFYLGHIPTFLDIHLSRLLEEPRTEPEEYKVSFSTLITWYS